MLFGILLFHPVICESVSFIAEDVATTVAKESEELALAKVARRVEVQIYANGSYANAQSEKIEEEIHEAEVQMDIGNNCSLNAIKAGWVGCCQCYQAKTEIKKILKDAEVSASNAKTINDECAKCSHDCIGKQMISQTDEKKKCTWFKPEVECPGSWENNDTSKAERKRCEKAENAARGYDGMGGLKFYWEAEMKKREIEEVKIAKANSPSCPYEEDSNIEQPCMENKDGTAYCCDTGEDTNGSPKKNASHDSSYGWTPSRGYWQNPKEMENNPTLKDKMPTEEQLKDPVYLNKQQGKCMGAFDFTENECKEHTRGTNSGWAACENAGCKWDAKANKNHGECVKKGDDVSKNDDDDDDDDGVIKMTKQCEAKEAVTKKYSLRNNWERMRMGLTKLDDCSAKQGCVALYVGIAIPLTKFPKKK